MGALGGRLAARRRLARVNRQGVQAGLKLARQSLVHRAMPRHPGKCCKLRGPDADGVVRLPAGPRPCVPMVKFAFVHYLKGGWGKRRN